MDREEVLKREASRNRAYLIRLRAKEEGRSSRGVSRARSKDWTVQDRPHSMKLPIGPFIGRVALAEKVPELEGQDFYIGSQHDESDGVQVFSWAADVAKLLYLGPSASYPWAELVVARRTLASNGEVITGYEDEGWNEVMPADAFPFASSLKVPAPPPNSNGGNVTSSRPRPSTSSQPATNTDARVHGSQARPPKVPPSESAPTTAPREGMTGVTKRSTDIARPKKTERAMNLVRQSLVAPRAGGLRSVLATLQPEQYRAVAASTHQSWVFQGHPGTGKTIIATHRAAYLTNPERPSRDGIKRVLLVGPTDGYASHARGALDELGAEQVAVTSLPQLVREVLRLPDNHRFVGPPDGDFLDVSWEAWEMVRDALGEFLDQPARSSASMGVESFYEFIRMSAKRAEASDEMADSSEALTWAGALPPWKTARQQRRLLPLLALVNVALRPPSERDGGFDHIIVDEAQDVRPVEWAFLSHYLASDSNTWTLLGDMDQRRTHHTAMDWQQLVDALRQHINPSARFTKRTLTTGYRSTPAILRLAGHLLPKGREEISSVQDESVPPSLVTAPSPQEVPGAAIKEALNLADRFPTGTIAIIVESTDALEGLARKREWRKGSGRAYRVPGQESLISIHSPTTARGLEFDGVVVVEPATFPENVTGPGPLYTSLTRANRELVVLHHRPLPSKLRRAFRAI